MEKAIWVLTKEECQEIRELFEKKLALENLFKIMDAESDVLRNKLVEDYGKVLNLFQSWWREISTKYNWEGQNWRINFDTQEVYIL